MNHELKTHNEPFCAIWDGSKTAEFRLNDRNFEVEDSLTLREWDHKLEDYTGRSIRVYITHIQTGYGIPEGYCMMGFPRLL